MDENIGSLLRSCLSGCHATLPRKEIAIFKCCQLPCVMRRTGAQCNTRESPWITSHYLRPVPVLALKLSQWSNGDQFRRSWVRTPPWLEFFSVIVWAHFRYWGKCSEGIKLGISKHCNWPWNYLDLSLLLWFDFSAESPLSHIISPLLAKS